MRNILLIRHGATALNSNDHTVDRIRGWTDWPLSIEGVIEAKALAHEVILDPPNVLLCSNLTRARQTAEIIADTIGHPPPYMTPAFLPWDVGDFVGKPASKVVPLLAHYAAQLPAERVPGGESFNTFRNRLFQGLLDGLSIYKGFIGIVTHHRCERLIKAWAKMGYPENGSIDLEEFTRKGDPTGHCEVISIPLHRLELWWQWACLQKVV